MIARAAAVLLLAAASATTATAQPFPPVTDRDFALDLHISTVLGSIRTIGMGGASVALVEQAGGMSANPAAPAVRAATSNDGWDWDASLDWLNPDLGEDFDNNGDPDGDGTVSVVTLGGALELGNTGLGVDLAITTRDLADLELSSIVIRLLVAQSFFDDILTVGIGLRGGALSLSAGEGGRDELLNVTAWSPTAGVLWRPKEMDLRLGAAVSLPASADVPECSRCGERIIPDRVRLPWELAVGAAWRFASTRWNVQIADEFRDERALTVAADVVVVGGMSDGYGLQRWTMGELQRSGASAVVSLRGGVDFEWIPGWLRVRAGSYWEPGRLEGTDGRLHGTGGAEVRVVAFRLFGHPYRIRLSFTIDGARDYVNGGLSVGLW